MIASLRATLAGQTPPPAPLPSLTTAFSRRAAIFGAVTASGALVASAAQPDTVQQLASSSADAALVSWCAELPEIDGALSDIFARAPDVEADSRVDALSTRWSAITDGILRTPARGPAGVQAKARVVRHLAAMRDLEVATPIAASLAADVLRLTGGEA